jgi:hypothetical protein
VRIVAHAARAACLVLLAVAVPGCGSHGPTFPPAGSSPAAPGDATSATKQQVIGALGAVGLQAVDATRPYRPPEGALLTGAARSVLQATLPDDPDHGYIAIYSLGSAVAAESAAFDQARYIASGPGGIQFPPGSHFVIRIVDSTVVFFTWSPGGSPDSRTHLIEDALNTLGVDVPVGG